MMNMELKTVELSKLKDHDILKSLFPVDKKVLSCIYSDIGKNGFDKSKPINVWKNKIVDGYTRVLAARKAGVKEVPVCEHEFKDVDEAIEYAIHCQVARRNLTDAEIKSCVDVMDKRKKVGRPVSSNSKELQTKLAPDGANLQRKPAIIKDSGSGKSEGKSAKELAEKIGVSPRKIERTRAVLAKGSEEDKEAVDKGELSINKAYEKVVGKKEKKIEEGAWVQWSTRSKAKTDVPNIDQLLARIKVAIEKGMLGWIMLGVDSGDEMPEFDESWDWIEEVVNSSRESGCIVYTKIKKNEE